MTSKRWRRKKWSAAQSKNLQNSSNNKSKCWTKKKKWSNKLFCCHSRRKSRESKGFSNLSRSRSNLPPNSQRRSQWAKLRWLWPRSSYELWSKRKLNSFKDLNSKSSSNQQLSHCPWSVVISWVDCPVLEVVAVPLKSIEMLCGKHKLNSINWPVSKSPNSRKLITVQCKKSWKPRESRPRRRLRSPKLSRWSSVKPD